MITAEKVSDQTLEQILSETKEDREAYKLTKDLVTAHLFSRYPEKRAYALKRLNEFWTTQINVVKIEDSGIIYAYLEFKNTDAYFLVSKYLSKGPVLEEVPTPEKMSSWASG